MEALAALLVREVQTREREAATIRANDVAKRIDPLDRPTVQHGANRVRKPFLF